MQNGTFFFSIAEATVAVSTASNVEKKETLRFRGDIELRLCQWFSHRLFYMHHSYYTVLGTVLRGGRIYGK